MCYLKKLSHLLLLSLLAICMINLKNTCEAYTWEAIDEFNNQLYEDRNTPQGIKNGITAYNNNKQSIKNYINSINKIIEDYSGIIFESSYTTKLYIYLQLSNSEIVTINNGLKATHCKILYMNSDGQISNIANDSDATIWWNSSSGTYWGLTNGTYNGTFTDNQYFENHYTPKPKIEFTQLGDIENITVGSYTNVYGIKLKWDLQDCYLGRLDNGSTLDYMVYPKLYLVNQDGTTNEVTNLVTQYDNIDREFYKIQYRYLYVNNLYKLTLTYDGEDTDYYYIALNNNTTITSGTTIPFGNPSGDQTSGYNTQDQTNDIIGQLPNESGEQGSGILGGIGNFFNGVYDKMFTTTSGEIYNAMTNIKDNNNVPIVDLYSGDLMVLNTLTGEPNDFVIAWNGIQYMNKTIIPSGDINFSARVRETQAMQSLINWVRILLGFSAIAILIQEYWFTFLKMLGIGVSIYEGREEERARLDMQESFSEYYEPETRLRLYRYNL